MYFFHLLLLSGGGPGGLYVSRIHLCIRDVAAGLGAA